MVEAIQLKEQVSGQVVTAGDSSSIRSFVRRAMIEDFAVPAPATMPATQPANVTNTATTQPSAVAEAPSTQPTTVAEVPSTQPVADASEQTEESVDSSAEVAEVEPSGAEPVEVETTVTEVSVEELDGTSFDQDAVSVEADEK
jgi:hypothetical protein